MRRVLSTVATVAVASASTTVSRAAPTFESRVHGAFFGALVADALSLGTHYEYDAKKIRKFYGAIDQYYAPGEKTGGETHGVGWGARNFHNGNGVGPAKAKGEQTDYGDYNILILEHLAATSQHPHRIDLGELLPTWQAALPKWRSWICTQTKQTYQQVQAGKSHAELGGNSNAMALRFAAAYAYYNTEEDVVHAAKAAMFTHRERTALQGGEFFARVTYRVLHEGLTPRQAIDQVAAISSTFVRSKVTQAIKKVEEATMEGSQLSQEEYMDDVALTSMARLWEVGKTEPIKVGKASPTEGTLPGSVYFILKYDGDYAAAIQANAEVGGDSASRAIAIGMVMGAAQGVEAIPANLGPGHLVEWERCEALLKQLPLLQKTVAKQEL